jgi:hypothetical protein
MNTSDLILGIVKEIKDDLSDIKNKMVTKEICSIKCTVLNKKIAAISSAITGVLGSLVLIVKYYVGRK